MATPVAQGSPEGYSIFRERLSFNLGRGRKIFIAMLHNRLALAGLIITLVFIGMAVFAPLLVGPYQGYGNLFTPNLGPSSQHPLGTDPSGKDIFNLLIYGSQVSLIVGFAASLMAMIVGTALGLVAGYYGRITDTLISRVTDFFLVIPWLPFVLVIVAVLGQSLGIIVFAVALVSWPTTTRVIRSQVLSLKERQFIERAKAVGASRGYILAHHILPNVMPLVWAEAVLTVSSSIFTEAFLSFFGLGWVGPTAIESWGQMVNKAYNHVAMYNGEWWYFAPPGILITLLVLGFALLGYGVEEILNPALKRRGGGGA